MSIVYCSGYDIVHTTFYNRNDIKRVDCLYKTWNNNSMHLAFSFCSDLKEIVHINENVTDMSGTFGFCFNLINVPEIPTNVTNMQSTFYYCTNILSTPTIPNSVTNMSSTFSDCYNLTEIADIPNSVTNMHSTFSSCNNLIYISKISSSAIDISSLFNGCESLMSSPIIPNSVTNMHSTYSLCNNLSGDIIINSENISSAERCFYNTNLNKDVYIPFTYENGVNTITFNSFINAGYSTENRVNGALLMDINSPYYEVDLSDYEYTIDGDKVAHLIKYIGTKNKVIQPRITRW